MRSLFAVLVVLLLAPLAGAAPVAREGNTYFGVAHVGSHDTETRWDDSSACIGALERFRYTLTVDGLAPTDTLLLEVEDVHLGTMRALATPSSPAVLEVVGPDGCPHFAVTGLVVALFAPYTLVAESMGPA